MRSLNRFSDRVLTRLLRHDVAGACVPEHGDSCGKPKYYCANGRLREITYGVVNCDGSCPAPVLHNLGTC